MRGIMRHVSHWTRYGKLSTNLGASTFALLVFLASQSAAGDEGATTVDPSARISSEMQSATLESISPYAIVNFAEEAEAQKGVVYDNPYAKEIREPAGEEGWNRIPPHDESKIPSTDDYGPDPIVDTPPEPQPLDAVVQESQNASMGYASVSGGWVRVGDSDTDNVRALGYFNAPSDMAICAGNGFVVQGVNSVFSVRDSEGNRRGSPLGLVSFLKTPKDRKGDESFDPRCIYDPVFNRFYLVAARKGGSLGSGNYYGELALGVSQTGDPTGNWYLYAIDGTSIGTPSTCVSSNPCWPDFPTLGQDQYGVWMGANMFQENGGYVTHKIWGLGKSQLMAGQSVTPQAYFSLNPGCFSIAPAATQGTSTHNTANGGTMYMLGSYGERNLCSYTFTQTIRLQNGGTPIYSGRLIGSQQLSGSSNARMQNGVPAGMGTSEISMAAYSGGKLYGMGTTGASRGGSTWRGLAWYVVDPVSQTITKQGIIAIENWNFFNPAVTANTAGNMAWVANVAGPKNPGIASAKGSIDGSTGAVGDITWFRGPDGQYPFVVTESNWRSGDYSAISLSDDGLVYGSTQQTQFVSGIGGIYQWGTAIWGKLAIS